MNSYDLFILIVPFSLFTIFVAFIFSLKSLKRKGAFYLIEILSSCFIIVILQLIELNAKQEFTLKLWSNIIYVPICLLPVFWYLFIKDYLSLFKPENKMTNNFLFIIPLLTIIFKITNAQFHFIWKENHFIQINQYTINIVSSYGFWFWIHLVYSYSLYIIGVIRILQQYRYVSPIYQKQIVTLAAGTIIPIIFNIIYVFRIIPGMDKDFSPLLISLVGLSFSLGIKNFKLLKINPFLPYQLIDKTNIFYLIFSSKGKILEINTAYKDKITTKNLNIGEDVFKVFPSLKQALKTSPTKFKEIKEQWTGNVLLNNETFEAKVISHKEDNKIFFLLYTIPDSTSPSLELKKACLRYAHVSLHPIIIINHDLQIIINKGLFKYCGYLDNELVMEKINNFIPDIDLSREGLNRIMITTKDELTISTTISLLQWEDEEISDSSYFTISFHFFSTLSVYNNTTKIKAIDL